MLFFLGFVAQRETIQPLVERYERKPTGIIKPDIFTPYHPIFPHYEEENEEQALSKLQAAMSEVQSGKIGKGKLQAIFEKVKDLIKKGEGKIDSVERGIINRLYGMIIGLLLINHQEENSLIEIPKDSELQVLLRKLQSDKFEKRKIIDVFERVSDILEKSGEKLTEGIGKQLAKWHDEILESDFPAPEEEENIFSDIKTVCVIMEFIKKAATGKVSKKDIRRFSKWLKSEVGKLGKFTQEQVSKWVQELEEIVSKLKDDEEEENKELKKLTAADVQALIEKVKSGKLEKGNIKEILEWIQTELQKGAEFIDEMTQELCVQLIQLLIEWILGIF